MRPKRGKNVFELDPMGEQANWPESNQDKKVFKKKFGDKKSIPFICYNLLHLYHYLDSVAVPKEYQYLLVFIDTTHNILTITGQRKIKKTLCNYRVGIPYYTLELWYCVSDLTSSVEI